MLGIIVACREGVHGVEAANTAGAEGCLGTTAHNHAGLAQTNQIEGIGQGVARRGTGRGGGIVGAIEAVKDRDLS